MKDRSTRQSFLGTRAPDLLSSATVAIIGPGGGGSHIAQQLAHVGVGNLYLFDPDQVEHSNLNRLVGATLHDAETSAQKVEVASRLIRGINPAANVAAYPVRWQLAATALREADVAISCVDTYAARQVSKSVRGGFSFLSST